MEKINFPQEKLKELEEGVDNVLGLMNKFNTAKEKGQARTALSALKKMKSVLSNIERKSNIYELKYDLAKRREIAEENDYEFVGKFNNGIAKMFKAGAWYFIDESGEIVDKGFGNGYQEIQDFKDGFAWVKATGKINYFVINEKLEDIFKKKNRAEMLIDINEGCSFIPADFVVTGQVKRIYYSVNLSKATMSNLSFDEVNDFHNAFARVKKGKRWFFINKDGEDIFPASFFDEIGDFNNGMARVRIAREWYYINEKGEFTFDNEVFDTALDFKDGIGRVRKGKEWSFIKENGSELFPNLYFDKILEFNNGFARAKDKDGWFFINEAGENICGKKRYRHLSDFNNGFAVVRDGEDRYFINENGEKAFPEMKFSKIESFHNGFARVRKGKSADWFFIDTKGNKVPENQSFSRIENFEDGVAIVVKKRKKYLINTRGEYLANGQAFENIEPFKDGVTKVKKDGAADVEIIYSSTRFGDVSTPSNFYIDIHGNRIFSKEKK